MVSILNAAATALLIGLASVGGAAEEIEGECRDDSGVDRCDPEQHRKVLELFGMRPIEYHRDRTEQVRRVFYVDGYGQDLLAISFVRAPGREPTVFVHFPRLEGKREAKPLEAPVPHDVWQGVLTRSAFFERELTSANKKTGEFSGCLHSWVYIAEANDPPLPNLSAASLRRKTSDACTPGPAEAFSDEVQKAALGLFPYCNRLDFKQHRNEAAQLAACRMLSGDRLAAAEVMNQARAFERVLDQGDLGLVRGLFAHDAVVDWNGERSPADHAAAASFWIRKVVEAGLSTAGSPSAIMGSFAASLRLERVEGLSAGRVRLIGSLNRSIEEANGSKTRYEQASVEQIWVLGSAEHYEVERITVGPWRVRRA